MFQEKQITEAEAKNKILGWIEKADSSSVCAVLEYAFGVITQPDASSAIRLVPGTGYKGEFGNFEEFSEPKKLQCECHVQENSLWKFFPEKSCLCGREKKHFHCKVCGGLITAYHEENSFVVVLPRIFGREIPHPLHFIEKKLAEGVKDFVIDASETVFVDSSAIGDLVKVSRLVKEGTVKITGLKEPLFNQFRSMRLNYILTIEGMESERRQEKSSGNQDQGS